MARVVMARVALARLAPSAPVQVVCVALLLLRLLRCVSFLCWGPELWLQGLGGLSAMVRLDVAGAGARPSSAC